MESRLKRPAQRGAISGTKPSKWPVLVVSVLQEVIQAQCCLMSVSVLWVPAAVLPSACLQEKPNWHRQHVQCWKVRLLFRVTWTAEELGWQQARVVQRWQTQVLALGSEYPCATHSTGRGQEATQQPWGFQLDWEAPSNLNYPAVSCLYGCSCFKQ